MIRIEVPALAIGKSKEYKENSDEIKNRFRNYGCFNAIKINDNSTTIVKIWLDNNFNRSFNSDEFDSIKYVNFKEFTVENVGAAALLAGEVVVYISYTPEESRAVYLIDRILGGSQR